MLFGSQFECLGMTEQEIMEAALKSFVGYVHSVPSCQSNTSIDLSVCIRPSPVASCILPPNLLLRLRVDLDSTTKSNNTTIDDSNDLQRKRVRQPSRSRGHMRNRRPNERIPRLFSNIQFLNHPRILACTINNRLLRNQIVKRLISLGNHIINQWDESKGFEDIEWSAGIDGSGAGEEGIIEGLGFFGEERDGGWDVVCGLESVDGDLEVGQGGVNVGEGCLEGGQVALDDRSRGGEGGEAEGDEFGEVHVDAGVIEGSRRICRVSCLK